MIFELCEFVLSQSSNQTLLDTTIKTYAGLPIKVKADVPVRLNVPIHESIRVNKVLNVQLNNVVLDLDAKVPIKTTVAIDQPIRVRGTFPVHLQNKINIPIDAVIPIQLDQQIQTVVDVDQSIPIKMSQIVIDYQSIGVTRRTGQ